MPVLVKLSRQRGRPNYFMLYKIFKCNYAISQNLNLQLRSRGFPDNLSTYGVISGLWGSSFALGAFAGPSLAGISMDYFGFRKSTYLVLATSCLSVK